MEVHGTHLRVVTPAVAQVSAYARRMEVDDLVLAFEQVRSIRRVGLMTAIVELPHRAAVAFTGPTVHSTLEHGAIPFAERRSRPFFVGFWLINHRSGRIHDSRPLP